MFGRNKWVISLILEDGYDKYDSSASGRFPLQKRKNNLLLLDFLFLDSEFASTGFGFIVWTAPQPQ
ncbi:hypothetical protein TNCV_2903521, partial [Trichonephila clavipes]